MTKEKSEGLLLQSIPYLGKSYILKVFTQQMGLISLFTKRKIPGSLTTTFCIGEWVYQKKLGDMYTLYDASLIDPLLDLRQSFACLSSAGRIAQDVLQSQLPHQGIHPLYELLCSYFKKIPQFSHPEILSVSFRLKLLIYEGLLSLKKQCSHCTNEACYLSGGESFCLSHAPLAGIAFTAEEWNQLHLLAFTLRFSILQELEMKASLLEKSSLILRDRLT